MSPVQMLVKKTSADNVKEITDFLTGKEFGKILADSYFLSAHDEVKNEVDDVSPLYWLGWDFFNSHDVGALKKTIEEVFLDEFNKSGGTV